MKTGAAYIRVSTEEQIEFSPDSQIKRIRDYAVSHEILLPEKFIFMDEGISGRSAEKRPAFMKMIGTAKMKPKPFDVILLWKFSRFARSRQDSILYKSMLRKECGIDVVSITEQLSDDPTSILIEALLEAMDEYYSINLAQEVRRGMNEKFSRGGVVSVPPFGYRMGEEHFEIDDDKANVVRMIFQDFLHGMPYRQIVSKINDMGIRTNRGNLFENRTVEYILTNPVYIGKLRRSIEGAEQRDRYYQGKQVVTVDAGHIPIVTAKSFDEVQKRVAALKKGWRGGTHGAPEDYMLRGLVHCSACGAVLTQAVRGKALQCQKYACGKCSQSHYITLDKLNQAVLNRLEADLGEEELEIRIEKEEKNVTKEVSRSLLDMEYKRLGRVNTAYESGADSLEEYRQKKSEILKRVDALRLELDRAGQLEGLSGTAQYFKKKLKGVIPGLRSSELGEADKNELLSSIVSKIVFNRNDNTIQIYYMV
ncbi:recombinase family protein [Ruminococcus sp. OA3]|uniref:recombinase family protein n=1 Tax=Ruminococcus sp. OA3 TaxID=2914164 RepID=UPI001F05902E|nr:recombinase family protein [Ruminococcus sp. OA3]MCH1983793.1 recombinase family protein [Ruminococcus sp. OA3]